MLATVPEHRPAAHDPRTHAELRERSLAASEAAAAEIVRLLEHSLAKANPPQSEQGQQERKEGEDDDRTAIAARVAALRAAMSSASI